MKNNNILIIGGTGMVGSALQKITKATYISSRDYDLRDPLQCEAMYMKYKPEYAIHLAAKVGGLGANKANLADFYYENIMINTNVLHYAKEHKVKKLLSLLSTCIYPDEATHPLEEKDIHSGEPHTSNFAYAYAKRMLDVQSRAYRKQYGCNFITAVPNNLYGEGDNFDLKNSHVIPAIIRKIYEAKLCNKTVILWGDGSPLREFTYAKDLAKVLLFLLAKYDEEYPINIGSSEEISIKTIAEIIAKEMNFGGEIIWDSSKPIGQFKKPSSKNKINSLGWPQAEYIKFEDGIKHTCDWFNNNYPNVRGIEYDNEQHLIKKKQLILP